MSQLYVVTQKVTPTQQLDLTLAQGCVVAVIKENDPMGNRDRWFIDNGGTFCTSELLPHLLLLRFLFILVSCHFTPSVL